MAAQNNKKTNVKMSKEQLRKYRRDQLEASKYESFHETEGLIPVDETDDETDDSSDLKANEKKLKIIPKREKYRTIREILGKEISKKNDNYEIHSYFLESVLDYFYPGDDEGKFLGFYPSISYYMKKPKSILTRGDLGESLNEVITKIHPDKFTYRYGGSNESDFCDIDWDDIKILNIINFEGCEKLILNRFIRPQKSFEVSKKEGGTIIKKRVPNVTVLTSPKKSRINFDIIKKSVMVELSSLKFQNYGVAKSMLNQAKNCLKNDIKKRMIKTYIGKLKRFLKNLDLELRVEIPFIDILATPSLIERSVIPLENLIDLIRCITFFNQNKRGWYEVKKTGKVYLLSNLNDLIYSLIITQNIYAIPSSNLHRGQIDFVNFIVNYYREKKQSRLSNGEAALEIYEIPIERRELTRAYLDEGGNLHPNTLNIWCDIFCQEIGILERLPKKENSLVEFYLRKFSLFQLDDYDKILEESRKSIDKREERLRNDNRVKYYDSNLHEEKVGFLSFIKIYVEQKSKEEGTHYNCPFSAFAPLTFLSVFYHYPFEKNEIINAYQKKGSNISEKIIIRWLGQFSNEELGFLKRVQSRKNGEIKYFLNIFRKIEYHMNKPRSEGGVIE